MKNQNLKITVYLEGKISKMTMEELKGSGLNVIVNRTNGYSHDWNDSEPFDEGHIQWKDTNPTVWCTKKPVGRIMGSSVVSFT